MNLKIKNVVKIVRTTKIKKNNYSNEGNIAIIDQSQKFISGYVNEKNFIEKESIVFGDHTCVVKFIDFPFVQGSDGVKIIQTSSLNISIKWIYYFLLNKVEYDGKYRRHWSDVANLLISIPPIKEQERIVKILDKFTELTTELTTELNLRKKQYQYYNDILFKKFNGINFKTISNFVDYVQPTKYIVKSTAYSNDFSIPVLTAGKSFILGYTNEKDGIYFASKEKPIILFDDFTTSFKWINFPFKVKSSALKILVPKENSNIRFLYFAMKIINYKPSEHSRQWIQKYSKIDIPAPPIKEQERIVEVLDKFEKLISKIEEGLPKEIELRNKQYEYYRKELLSF